MRCRAAEQLELALEDLLVAVAEDDDAPIDEGLTEPIPEAADVPALRRRPGVSGHCFAIPCRAVGGDPRVSPKADHPCAPLVRRVRMVDILALGLHHDEQAVLAACEMALAEGVATKTHVLNLLHRLVDGEVTDGPDIHRPARTQDAHVYLHERGLSYEGCRSSGKSSPGLLLWSSQPKRRRYSSYPGEISPAPASIINRAFQASAPNEKWLTDITEFHIRAGKVYLSPIIDCRKGLVISWAIGTKPDPDPGNTMLDAAVETIAEREARPIIHSDRGGHYRWPGRLERINTARLVRSMSRKASSQDNAAGEGFLVCLKTGPSILACWAGLHRGPVY